MSPRVFTVELAASQVDTDWMDLVVNMPSPGGLERPSPSSRRFALLVASASVVTAIVATASLWPFWFSDPVSGAINLLVAVSFVATGVALAEIRHHRTTALALVAAAAFWLMSWWWAWPPEWQVGPTIFLSNVFGYMWFVIGGIALLRYPDAVLGSRIERGYFAGLAIWVCGSKLAIAFVSRPEWWADYSPTAWWPTLVEDRYLRDEWNRVSYGGIVVFAVAMLPLLLNKLRRSRGIDRLDSLPVTVAAVTVTITGAAYLSARLFYLPAATIDALQTSMGAAALVTPLAFLMAVLRRRLARTAVADLVIRIAAAPTVGRVQSELRRVLQDAALTLWVWDEEKQEYADDTGWACVYPSVGNRWSIPVKTSAGGQLAVLALDERLRKYLPLVEAAVVAAGLALEVQAQLSEVRSSRMRIAAAAVDERRRLEQDLHDGAQQSLLAAAASLSAAGVYSQEQPQARAAIGQASDDLQTALRELRQLARGLHPAVLSQSGLAPALEEVAERLPLDVRLNIPARRWSPRVESTVYFLVCEALTNVVKHAGAGRASVIVESDDDLNVNVCVSDDGCGGASATRDSGLYGMRDRVQAMGGTLLIDSSAGAGTSITASIPCG